LVEEIGEHFVQILFGVQILHKARRNYARKQSMAQIEAVLTTTIDPGGHCTEEWLETLERRNESVVFRAKANLSCLHLYALPHLGLKQATASAGQKS
jgi:hypothetical protein